MCVWVQVVVADVEVNPFWGRVCVQCRVAVQKLCIYNERASIVLRLVYVLCRSCLAWCFMFISRVYVGRAFGAASLF